MIPFKVLVSLYNLLSHYYQAVLNIDTSTQYSSGQLDPFDGESEFISEGQSIKHGRDRSHSD